MHEAIDGVVIRIKDTGNNSRYLSVLTAEQGRISLLSKGSHSMKTGQMAISQLYSYANYEYYIKGTAKILKGGAPIRVFYGIGADLDRLNLTAYLCDLIAELTDEGEAAHDMLRLTLNMLHAVDKQLYPAEVIKGAVELRAVAMSGYAPELDGCSLCGRDTDANLYFDVMNGALLCSSCLSRRGRQPVSAEHMDPAHFSDVLSPLTPAAVAAVRYCVMAPLSRLFAFELADAEDMRLFCAAAETYALSHIGHGFATLDFYRAMQEQ